MALVGCQIQRWQQLLDERRLDVPRRRVLHPTDEGILAHPVGQHPLACAKRHSLSAANPTQLNPKPLTEEAPEGEPEGRTFGVAGVVLADSIPEGAPTDLTTLRRRFRGDTDAEEGQPFVGDAAGCGDAGSLWHGQRIREDFISAPHPRRIAKRIYIRGGRHLMVTPLYAAAVS